MLLRLLSRQGRSHYYRSFGIIVFGLRTPVEYLFGDVKRTHAPHRGFDCRRYFARHDAAGGPDLHRFDVRCDRSSKTSPCHSTFGHPSHLDAFLATVEF